MHVSLLVLLSVFVGISTCMFLMSTRVPINKKPFIITRVHATIISSGPEILLSQEKPPNLQEATREKPKTPPVPEETPELLAVPEETPQNLPKPEKLLTSLTKKVIRVDIVVHIHNVRRYKAVVMNFKEQPMKYNCEGTQVRMSTSYFKFKCDGCPESMHALKKLTAFERTVTMLQNANKDVDFVFKMDDDTWLDTSALGRRVCNIKTKRYYGGFKMHAENIDFVSGGAGYLLSTDLIKDTDFTKCVKHKYEDVGLAKCLYRQHSVTPVHLDVNPDTPEKMIEWGMNPSSDHLSKPTFCNPVTFHYIEPERQMKMKFCPGKRFPKFIHQIWIGSKDPPIAKINSCRSLHPDWNVILWTEDKLKSLKYDSKYQAPGSFSTKMFAHNGDILKRVDVLKLELLYRYGGIAMDADQICLRRLDKLLDIGLDYDYAAAHEHEHKHAGEIKNLIANGVQMSHQYSPTIFNVLTHISALRSGDAWTRTGPCLVSQDIAYYGSRNVQKLQQVVKKCGHVYKKQFEVCPQTEAIPIKLLPSDFFYPYHHSEKQKMKACENDITDSFTVQHWSSTSVGYSKSKEKLSDYWLLDERNAVLSGNWNKRVCLDKGLESHHTTKDSKATILYTPICSIPIGSRIVFSKSASVSINNGTKQYVSELKTTRTVSSIKIYGSSPTVHVYLPKNYEFVKKTKYEIMKHKVEKQSLVGASVVEISPFSLDLKKRFDIIVKAVCASEWLGNEKVSDFTTNMYKKHLEVWNNFKEPCIFTGEKDWFDASKPCVKKTSAQDFIISFHKTIQSLKDNGFDNSKSIVPVTKNLFPLNGAHRIAAAIALRMNTMPVQITSSSHSFDWDANFFKNKGFDKKYADFAMLQFLIHSPQVATLIFWPEAASHEKIILAKKMVTDNLSVIYSKQILLNKKGVASLTEHAYGQQNWLSAKIKMLQTTFNDEVTKKSVIIMFTITKQKSEMDEFKMQLRKQFNLSEFKSSVHISDFHAEASIVGEMVLNDNSVMFMNRHEGQNCREVSHEIALRKSLKEVNPGLSLHTQDIMVDSGAVMSFFGLRERTDIDILFQNEIDKSLLGWKNNILVEAHKIESHGPIHGRPSAELFSNTSYFGYCHGLKFVSLEQLRRYKLKRGELNKSSREKDWGDVKKIDSFLQAKRYKTRRDEPLKKHPPNCSWPLPLYPNAKQQPQKYLNTLKSIQLWSEQNNDDVVLYLQSGGLLGLYRDGTLIPTDSDIDIRIELKRNIDSKRKSKLKAQLAMFKKKLPKLSFNYLSTWPDIRNGFWHIKTTDVNDDLIDRFNEMYICMPPRSSPIQTHVYTRKELEHTYGPFWFIRMSFKGMNLQEFIDYVNPSYMFHKDWLKMIKTIKKMDSDGNKDVTVGELTEYVKMDGIDIAQYNLQISQRDRCRASRMLNWILEYNKSPYPIVKKYKYNWIQPLFVFAQCDNV